LEAHTAKEGNRGYVRQENEQSICDVRRGKELDSEKMNSQRKWRRRNYDAHIGKQFLKKYGKGHAGRDLPREWKIHGKTFPERKRWAELQGMVPD